MRDGTGNSTILDQKKKDILPITFYRTCGRTRTSGRVTRVIRAAPPTDAHTPCSPVDHGEEGVVDTEDDREVEVVDVDGSGSDHDVYQTADCVDGMEEHI